MQTRQYMECERYSTTGDVKVRWCLPTRKWLVGVKTSNASDGAKPSLASSGEMKVAIGNVPGVVTITFTASARDGDTQGEVVESVEVTRLRRPYFAAVRASAGILTATLLFLFVYLYALPTAVEATTVGSLARIGSSVAAITAAIVALPFLRWVVPGGRRHLEDVFAAVSRSRFAAAVAAWVAIAALVLAVVVVVMFRKVMVSNETGGDVAVVVGRDVVYTLPPGIQRIYPSKDVREALVQGKVEFFPPLVGRVEAKGGTEPTGQVRLQCQTRFEVELDERVPTGMEPGVYYLGARVEPVLTVATSPRKTFDYSLPTKDCYGAEPPQAGTIVLSYSHDSEKGTIDLSRAWLSTGPEGALRKFVLERHSFGFPKVPDGMFVAMWEGPIGTSSGRASASRAASPLTEYQGSCVGERCDVIVLSRDARERLRWRWPLEPTEAGLQVEHVGSLQDLLDTCMGPNQESCPLKPYRLVVGLDNISAVQLDSLRLFAEPAGRTSADKGFRCELSGIRKDGQLFLPRAVSMRSGLKWRVEVLSGGSIGDERQVKVVPNDDTDELRVTGDLAGLFPRAGPGRP